MFGSFSDGSFSDGTLCKGSVWIPVPVVAGTGTNCILVLQAERLSFFTDTAIFYHSRRGIGQETWHYLNFKPVLKNRESRVFTGYHDVTQISAWQAIVTYKWQAGNIIPVLKILPGFSEKKFSTLSIYNYEEKIKFTR
jgi:hypothetical protein